MRCAGGDAALHRREVLVCEMRHRAGGELGLEQTAYRIDLRHVELVEEEIVLQELQGAIAGTLSGSELTRFEEWRAR